MLLKGRISANLFPACLNALLSIFNSLTYRVKTAQVLQIQILWKNSIYLLLISVGRSLSPL